MRETPRRKAAERDGKRGLFRQRSAMPRLSSDMQYNTYLGALVNRDRRKLNACQVEHRQLAAVQRVTDDLSQFGRYVEMQYYAWCAWARRGEATARRGPHLPMFRNASKVAGHRPPTAMGCSDGHIWAKFAAVIAYTLGRFAMFLQTSLHE